MKHLLFVLLFAIGRAGDCVPQTFSTLSYFMGAPRSADAWSRDIMPDSKTPSLLFSIGCWNNYNMLNQLTCVYSNLNKVSMVDEEVKYDRPYLWIGKMPPELVEDPNSTEVHCAIVIVTSNDYELIHTLSPGKYYYEHLKTKEFISRTYLVFKISGLTNWRPL